MTDAMSAVAAIGTRDRTAALAHQALPNAPTIPEPERPPRSPGGPAANLRHGLGVALRRLADRLDPSPIDRTPLTGGSC